MNKHFDNQPADRPAGDEQREEFLKITTEPWQCRWEYKGSCRVLTVPGGYIYDGASVPRLFWSFIGLWPDGLIRAGALAHDALYRSKGGELKDKLCGCILTSSQGNAVKVSRDEADWVLKEFMKAAGMWRHRCGIAWLAVRIGGSRHWGGPMPNAPK